MEGLALKLLRPERFREAQICLKSGISWLKIKIYYSVYVPTTLLCWEDLKVI